MSNPFDYVNSILVDKKHMMRGTENDKMAEDGYNPWLTNSALSYHEDTILMANLVNGLHHLSKRAQYELLHAMVRPKKRQFRKWAKASDNEDIEAVCKVYSCNKTVAQEYLTILTKDQVEKIKQSLVTGGKI